MTEKLLRLKDAADLLSLKECTLRKWALRRVIRTIKLGSAIRIPESEIVRLIAQGEVPARGVRQ
jgi:excisionase family DNA binding protein